MRNAIETKNYRGYPINIYQDDFEYDPLDDDDVLIFSFRIRYTMTKHNYELNQEGFDQCIDDLKKDYYYFPLYFYEHGGLVLSLSDFKDKWDSGVFGIIAVPKKNYKSKIQAEKRLRDFLKYYNAYINGEIIKYIIEKNGEIIDTAGGYMSIEDAINDAKIYIDDLIKREMTKHIEKRKIQIQRKVPLEKRLPSPTPYRLKNPLKKFEKNYIPRNILNKII